MPQIGERAEAFLEAVKSIRFRQPQDLERHQRLLLTVIRLVNHAEGAGAETFLHQKAVCAHEMVGIQTPLLRRFRRVRAVRLGALGGDRAPPGRNAR